MNKIKLFEVYQIPNYPQYELHYNDDEQKVWSKKKGDYLKNKLTPNGYFQVNLYNSEGIKGWYLHRIVYTCLKGEIPEGYEVNHINEDKLDNRISNLNLMTRSQNINYGTRNQRNSEKMLNRQDLSKQVVGINKKTLDLIEFPSTIEAMRQDKKFNNSAISNCCKHKISKTVNKYYFFYKSEFDKLLTKFNGDIKNIIEYKISKYG